MTDNQLKKMILKEMFHIMDKHHNPYKMGDLKKHKEIDPDGYEGKMAKQNLWKIAKYASELHNIIQDNENLEPWVEEKIAVASQMIDSVAHYLEYEKISGG